MVDFNRAADFNELKQLLLLAGLAGYLPGEDANVINTQNILFVGQNVLGDQGLQRLLQLVLVFFQ